MYPSDVMQWLARKEQEDRRLYEKYGRSLETDHAGEFVAINSDGQFIVDADSDEVLRQAVQRFGSGNFAIKRVGEKAFGEWLSSRQS